MPERYERDVSRGKLRRRWSESAPAPVFRGRPDRVRFRPRSP